MSRRRQDKVKTQLEWTKSTDHGSKQSHFKRTKPRLRTNGSAEFPKPGLKPSTALSSLST